MEKQVTRRVQVSKWCRVVFYDDGTRVIWKGAARIELSSSWEITRLANTLLAGVKENQEEEEIDALYAEAKADESGYRAFLDAVVGDDEYAAHVEHVNTPRASEY